MLAAVAGPDGLSVEDVESVGPAADDVVVRISASAICRSDLLVLDGSVPCPRPLLLGHEGCGVVEAVGSRVTEVAPGDRVVLAGVPSCGRCPACLRGQGVLCTLAEAVGSVARAVRRDGAAIPAMAGLGAFAERMVTHRACVVRVDTTLPDDQLALIGCAVTTGVGAALLRAGIEPGGSVAVVGCGGVGLSAIQGALIAGAAVVIGVDPSASRCDTARAVGATHVVQAASSGAVEAVLASTGGDGVDSGVDVVGAPETIADTMRMTRRGGTITVVGAPHAGQRMDLDLWSFFRSEQRLSSCRYGSVTVRRDLPRFARLAEAGRIDLSSMITARFALPELARGIAAFRAGSVVRAVVTP
jgi:S-(hydroxymethyl)glutathione dehydrogenase/alcohol dehydrogenase